MLIACLGLVFVVISLYKLSMTVPQTSRIIANPLGASAPLTNGEQAMHQAQTSHMHQPNNSDTIGCTAASGDHEQQQPQAASEVEADPQTAILLSQLQQVLPQAAVTLSNGKRQFSLELLHVAIQTFLERQHSTTTTASESSSQQGMQSESMQDAPASSTTQNMLPVQSMKEGRVALCLLMLNQWCTDVRHHSNDIPYQAAAIIDTVLTSDRQVQAQPTAVGQPAADAQAMLSHNSHAIFGLVRHPSLCSISSYPDYASYKAADDSEDEDDRMLDAACDDCDKPNHNGALRSYQQEALDKLKQPGNYILAAPTGSGKTRVAVELATFMLQHNPNAKIVFLANTVALAQQQAEVFAAAESLRQCNARVECFAKGAKMNPRKWRVAIMCDTVLVMTAQQLLNMLGTGVAMLQQLQLLVLDECHHCLKHSPYSQIMQLYRQMPQQQQALTKVLGLTASPGAGINEAEAYQAQWQLAHSMCATYHIVPHDHPEVQSHVARAIDRTIVWHATTEDKAFASSLAGVLWSHVAGFASQLEDTQGFGLANTQRDLSAGRWAPELKAWFRILLNPSRPLAPKLTAYLKLLRDCNAALSLAGLAGYAVALHFLGNRCLEALQCCHDDLGPAAFPDGNAPEEAADLVTLLLWDIADRVCRLPLATKAVQARHNSACIAFPKFLVLVQFLQDMVDQKSSMHGIVFVTERQGVHALASMLRGLPDLADQATIHTFTGHPAKTKLQLMAEGATAGMHTQQQQAALLQFKQATGREILIGTAAAEEGLDIVNCEFVVCYSVTESGRQRIQRRGRARMEGSIFLNIVEADSAEQAMLNKSSVEETSSRLAQMSFQSQP